MSDRRHRDLKRTLTSLAAEHGGSVELTKTKGGHVRARFTLGNRKTDVFMGWSPSDHRAARNGVAVARRVLRAAAGRA